MNGSIFAVERCDGDTRQTASHAHGPGQLFGSLAGLLSVSNPVGNWVVPVTHAVWIPPQVPHALRSYGPFMGWSVYIEEAACARLATEPQVIRVSGLLREAVHRIVAWGRGPRSESEHRLGNVLIDEIAMLPPEPLSLAYPNDFRLRQITDGILSNLADERGMEDWARLAGITTRTLARRFVAETGFGFSEWRQRAKVLRAIELLAENMPVTTIAVDLGYTNVSAFIAMFTRILGTTPGCYARSQLERSGRSIPGH